MHEKSCRTRFMCDSPFVLTPQAVWIACNAAKDKESILANASFNTASGMDCMQYETTPNLYRSFKVSIPQAVWIACNFCQVFKNAETARFQYRKRYGLHAI